MTLLKMDEKEKLAAVIELEDKGDYDRALEHLSAILTDAPNTYQALFLKFRINKRKGFIDKTLLEKGLKEEDIFYDKF